MSGIFPQRMRRWRNRWIGEGLEKFADIHFLLLHFVLVLVWCVGLKKVDLPYHLLSAKTTTIRTPQLNPQYPLCISSLPSPIPPAPPAPPSSLLTPLPVL